MKKESCAVVTASGARTAGYHGDEALHHAASQLLWTSGSSLGHVGWHALTLRTYFHKMTMLLQCGVAFEAEHITVRLLRRLTSTQKASLHVGKAKIPTDRLVAGVLPSQSPHYTTVV